MPRTVVPSLKDPATARGPLGGDDPATKLVKYVPAETLAFFIPAAAVIGADQTALLVLALAAGAVGTFGYLWLQAQRESDPAKRPLTHYYPLAVVAFGIWAIATSSNVASMLGLDGVAAGILLMVGVFLIPLADGVLTTLFPRKPSAKSAPPATPDVQPGQS